MSGEVAHLHNLQTRARHVQTSSSVPALRQFTCSSTALPLKKGGEGYLGKDWSVLGTLQPSQELRSESHPSPTASWGHSSAAVARVATTRVVPGISSVHAKLHSPASVITRAAPPTRCFFHGPVHALCVAFPHLAASRQTSWSAICHFAWDAEKRGCITGRPGFRPGGPLESRPAGSHFF